MPATFACASCNQQYGYSPELVGKQVRCQKCGAVFAVPNLHSAPEPVLAAPLAGNGHSQSYAPAGYASTGAGTRIAHEIDYRIFGDDMQYVEVTLDPQETVISEAGSMFYTSPQIKMETVFGDPSQQNQGFWGKMMSAGKRVLTGESLFMTTFTNVGLQRKAVAFAAPYPGKIVPMHLDQLGGELICQKDSLLAGAKGIQISIAFQKKIGVALFGGEGFIMQRLTGDGIALIHAGGCLVEKTLAAGEMLKLDTGCLVALQPSVNYDIAFVGGFKNTLFGGEGLFLATLTGPGRIWLQSLPLSRLAGRIIAAAPGIGSSNKDEGSLLGSGLGSIGSMLLGDNE